MRNANKKSAASPKAAENKNKSNKPAAKAQKAPKHDPLKIVEDYVKRYLDDYAAHDEQFAAKYHRGDKTVHGAVLYIIQEEYKQCVEVKVPGVPKCKFAGNSDDVHYGWAVHYFDEDSIKEVKELPAEAKQAMQMAAGSSASNAYGDHPDYVDDVEETEAEAKPKRNKKPARQPAADPQQPKHDALFDGLGIFD